MELDLWSGEPQCWYWGVFLLLGPREGRPHPCLPRLDPTLLFATGLRGPWILVFSSKDRKRAWGLARSQPKSPNSPNRLRAPRSSSSFRAGAATPAIARRWRQATAWDAQTQPYPGYSALRLSPRAGFPLPPPPRPPAPKS